MGAYKKLDRVVKAKWVKALRTNKYKGRPSDADCHEYNCSICVLSKLGNGMLLLSAAALARVEGMPGGSENFKVVADWIEEKL